MRQHSEYVDDKDNSGQENASDSEEVSDEGDNDLESDNGDTESHQDNDEEDNKLGGAESDESEATGSGAEDDTYSYDEVVTVLRFYLQQQDNDS